MYFFHELIFGFWEKKFNNGTSTTKLSPFKDVFIEKINIFHNIITVKYAVSRGVFRSTGL